jgi:hypothetical protein
MSGEQVTKGGPPSSGRPPETVDLNARAEVLNIEKPTLQDRVADEVLKLFRYSLWGTLVFAGIILLFDEGFVSLGVIKPDQRLLSEKVLMTLIGATVVQVGAALGAMTETW